MYSSRMRTLLSMPKPEWCQHNRFCANSLFTSLRSTSAYRRPLCRTDRSSRRSEVRHRRTARCVSDCTMDRGRIPCRRSDWASRAEVVVSAFRIGISHSRDPLQIVTASGESFADLLDSLQSVHPIGRGVFLIVMVTEVGEVAIEDRVKFVPAPGHILPLGNWNGRIPE